MEQIHRGRLLSPEIVDHSAELEELLSGIGFDYEMGDDAIRVFGYAPRDKTDFRPTTKAEQAHGEQRLTGSESE